MKKTSFIILLVFALTATAMASMVIAPSQIIVNLDDRNGNNNKKTTNDTIKAIISYQLNEYEIVDMDPDSFEIYMILKNSDGFQISVPAETIRYCYIDSNLIFEFRRADVVDEIVEYENDDVVFSGVIEVNIEGFFTVNKNDGEEYPKSVDIPSVDIREEDAKSEIFVYNRPNNKL